jgi:hypothetical protein
MLALPQIEDDNGHAHAPARFTPVVGGRARGCSRLRASRRGGGLSRSLKRALFATQGYDVAGGTPEDFRRTLERDVDTWSKVIREANIRFD